MNNMCRGAAMLCLAATAYAGTSEDAQGPALVPGQVVSTSQNSGIVPDFSRLLIQVWEVQEDEARTRAYYFAGPRTKPDPIPVTREGKFQLQDLRPGDYYVDALRIPVGWWIKSATFGNDDVLDSPMKIGSTIGSKVLEFRLSDKHPSVSGTVRNSTGGSVGGVEVIVFSDNPNYWRLLSKRIRSVRADASGKYVIGDLPPGAYLVAVITEQRQPSQSYDTAAFRAFLGNLAKVAVAFHLGEDENKVQDVQIKVPRV